MLRRRKANVWTGTPRWCFLSRRPEPSSARRPGMKRLVLVALSVCLTAAASSFASGAGATQDASSGSYIVVFKADAVRSAAETPSQRPLVATAAREARPGTRWPDQLRLPARARGLRRQVDPGSGRVTGPQSARRLRRGRPGRARLSRADPRNVGPRSRRPAQSPLTAPTSTTDGLGRARAYIIDTGIRRTRVDFGGRAGQRADTVGDGRKADDCNGHGTHVAGTVGGTTYGVAKRSRSGRARARLRRERDGRRA